MRYALYTTGLALSLVVGAACGSDSMEALGETMVDAGHALVDAGAHAHADDAGPVGQDAGSSASQGNQVRTIRTECVEGENGWFAEADADIDTARVQNVTVILCGVEGGGRPNLLECSTRDVSFDETTVRTGCDFGSAHYTDARFVINRL